MGPYEPILARSIQQDLRRGLSEIFAAAFACMIRLDATSGFHHAGISRTVSAVHRIIREGADERMDSRRRLGSPWMNRFYRAMPRRRSFEYHMFLPCVRACYDRVHMDGQFSRACDLSV